MARAEGQGQSQRGDKGKGSRVESERPRGRRGGLGKEVVRVVELNRRRGQRCNKGGDSAEREVEGLKVAGS